MPKHQGNYTRVIRGESGKILLTATGVLNVKGTFAAFNATRYSPHFFSVLLVNMMTSDTFRYLWQRDVNPVHFWPRATSCT